jgi:predicted O-methyltransferase YrrM
MSDTFDSALARRVDAYVEGLFVKTDPALAACLEDAAAEGLPPIHVSPNEGKLLHLLARVSGAGRILEIGTLGGYSAIWLGRALPPEGRLVSLEVDPTHAKVARTSLARAGLGGKVEVLVGLAEASLRSMIERGERPFDLVFIDADKPGYVNYLHLSMQLSRPGTLILADNLIRNGRVMDERPTDESAAAARAYNEAIARHPRLDSLVLPIIRDDLDGLSISIVKGPAA